VVNSWRQTRHIVLFAARNTVQRAPAPRSVRCRVFALRTRCGLHAAPASACISCSLTKSASFALPISSTWSAGRYFLPFVGSFGQIPVAVGNAGFHWKWNACSFVGVHFIPTVTTLATSSAMFLAVGALEWHTVVAFAYVNAARSTGQRAPAPRSIRCRVFADRTRWSLHAAPASACITCSCTISASFALPISSTWSAGRYFLPFVGSFGQIPVAGGNAVGSR